MYRIYLIALLFWVNTSTASNETKYNENRVGFTENRGQVLDQNLKPNKLVQYLLKTPGLNIQIRKNGFSYDSYNVEKRLKPGKTLNEGLLSKQEELENINSYEYTCSFNRVDIEFENGLTNGNIKTSGKSTDYTNYYNIEGNLNGIQNIYSYQSITIENIYPNIDIEFVYNESGFKYNLIVKPGADLNQVRFKYTGAPITLKKNQINIETLNGSITENIPKSWYADNPRNEIAVKYILYNENTIGFSGKLNQHKTLIIDPIGTRIWGTYYGGISNDYGYCTTTDSSNNVFLAGYTVSSTFIATSGAHQTSIAGSWDAYLVKFNSSGIRQWSTYFGGSGSDQAFACVADINGNIFLTGMTQSTNNISTSGAHQISSGGNYDAFLAKFNYAGVRQWSTYYGGSSNDQSYGCTSDLQGNIYICGSTQSNTGISTSGSHQPNIGGFSYDAFLIKFNSFGVRQWGTYYGGPAVDIAYACNANASGNIAICGNTQSNINIATPSGHQTTYGAGQDAFLVLFNSSGVRLWGTYYGGSSNDIGNSCKFDGLKNIYLAGTTQSANNIGSTGAFQSTSGGNADAYIVKFNFAGTRLWGTYYGGVSSDQGNDCFATDSGEVFLTGVAQSTVGISTIGAHQVNLAGNGDAFLVKFNETGDRQWGTFYGGMNDDVSRSVTADKLGKVYISGETNSNSGISTTGIHQPNYNAFLDAYLAKLEGCSILENIDSIFGNNIICDSTLQSYQAKKAIGASGYFWEVPNGWEITSGQGTQTIQVMANQNSGLVKVKAFNSCSDTGLYYSLQVSIIGAIDSLIGIVGSNQVCKNSVNSFSVNLANNATSYNWKLPAGWQITSGLGSNSVQVLTNNDTGTISVQAINFCGDSSNIVYLSLTHFVAPAEPTLITGIAKICGGTNYSYSVQSVANATGYFWSIPQNWILNSGQNSNTINVTAGNSAGNISVKAYNNCGDTTDALLFFAEPYPAVTTTDSIKGNGYICAGTYQTFTIDSIPNAISYQWTLPLDWFLISGQGTKSIYVVTSFHAGDLTVTPKNFCGIAGTTIAKYISIAPQSEQPGFILGSKNICNNTNQTYSVATAANAVGYQWSLPAGWVVLSGQGTNVINVKSSNISGDVNVKTYNSCGDSSLSATINVDVIPLPTLSGPINGPAIMCANESKEFIIPTSIGASYYRWNIPAGWQIITGDSTYDITVLANDKGGTLSVRAINACGDSSNLISKAITIENIPTLPGEILGPTSVNSLSDVSYVVNQVLGLSYTWTIPSDWVIMSGQGTNLVQVRTGTQNGEIKVTASNNCGTSAEKTLTVNIAGTGIEKQYVGKLSLFPNPLKTGQSLALKIEQTTVQANNYKVVDITGRVLTNKAINLQSSDNYAEFDTANLKAGSYLLLLEKQHAGVISLPFIVY